MIEKQIRCPRCKRSQPESLGACDFCAEMDQDYAQERLAEEQAEQDKKEMGEEDES